ncbi:glutathione S-transferase family protein [Parvibaculum sp.]|uniref:glutathione S-transferase family protein n=1 Tax=Parvibaculum sp. TaxID=2024848 RepID=UPI002C6D1DD8|nr:glutathione S-transferase family protein [Parvibaculum sp.]HUD52150.1 glutathione S-transferase family protein [Parvibaculum sp.]
MSIRLHELVTGDNRALSPYVWRIKYALSHKGLAYETAPAGFTEIPKLCGGKFRTVPIIEDGDTTVCDSWVIADYLDKTYPARPVFSSPQERAMVKFFDAWFGLEVVNRMFAICVLDIHNHARPEDRAYFRESREKRIGGKTLEQFVDGREQRLPELRHALRPMRAALAQTPFIGGETPNYADYIALGGFLWAGAVCTLPLLAKDDPINDWLQRGFDLYGGLGHVPLYPLAA